ncbi:MAG TPA: carboxypeptidase regulatory-like domain-containing protein, partial [Acidobacteriaceae bacterium]|nr:carboxypeptidase regulatory-like domain-containing protein [Acidobacteriaceae bacterium]
DEYLGRVDQEFGAKDRFFAHYYYNDFNNNGVLNPSNLLTYSDMSNIRFQSALLSETHIFTNNLLNNLVVNYSREISIRGPLANAPDAASFGVNIYQPAQKSIQGISASGFFQVGDNPQATFQRNNYTLADDLHWIKGRHSMGFGVHAELSKFDINSLFQLPGTFTFNSNTTNYALASFLLGYLYQFNQGSGQYLNVRNHFLGFYGQDNWQITRRFSLNYGLRYEPYFPWQELRHRISQFNPAAYNAGRRSTVYRNAPPGLLFPGDTGVPEQGVRNSYTDIMPRVGFAWDVFGTGKTSLRGGGGVFYDTRTPGSMLGQGASATPFSVSVTLTQPIGTFSNPYAGITNPFPAPTVPAANTVFPTPVTAYTFDPSGNYKVAVTYDWNLTGEQQITNNLLARIAYVGSHASHIFTALDLNPAIYTPGSTLSTNQRRYYQPYSSIVETNMGGNIGYNSLQATLQQRMANGLTLMANYTFAKALDDLPYGGTGGYGNSGPGPGGSYVYPVTFANYKALDRGPADFDFRNTFSASYVWDLPRLVNGTRPLRAILNDWETTGIFQAQSGGPVTVVAGSDRSQTGLLQDRAQTVSGQYALGGNACRGHNGPCVNWLNPAAFTQPAIGSFGNVQKGAYRGPGYFDWDAGLLRNFHFTEQAMLQFRAEYFNILNRANFQDPVSSVSSGGFGSVTSASDPRIAQLALKMIF